MFNEWHAIVRAPGYGKSFASWLLSWEFVGHFPIDFPSLDWLTDVCRLLEFDCEAQASQEAQLRRKSLHFHVMHDEAFDCSAQGFRALRPDAKPPFTAVTTEVSQQVSRVAGTTLGEWQIYVPRPNAFREGEPVSLGPAVGLVVSKLPDSVLVAFGADPVPGTGSLVQQHHDCTPAELHRGFSDYWSQWWRRDSVEESQNLSLWPQFQRFLQQYPCQWPEIQIDFLDLAAWTYARKKMKTRSSSGSCGFSVAEVKALPEAALLHVARLFKASLPYHLPAYLLTGRVNVLAKVLEPSGYTDGRPICVLSVLYRLWTSVCCRKLLQAWADRMPAGIYGGLPGRSARDSFILDIIKCFNALPRMPMQALLIHLGCPAILATAWISGLAHLGRASSFVGDISELSFSTTGLPEGDGMSVASALTLGWLFAVVISDFGLSPQVFIDNWAWTTEDEALHAAGIEQTLQLTSSLKLEVDWRKTFGWSRHVEGQRWWHDHAATLVPQCEAITVLREAKDLGAAMRYRSSRSLGCIKQRLL